MVRVFTSRGSTAALCLALWAAVGCSAQAATTQITRLTDVAFTGLNPFATASNAQSVCVYTSTGTYSVTATGNGTASAFTLSAGGSVPVLAYSVAWSGTASQTSGTTLTAAVPQSGFTSSASALGCSLSASTSASLIVSIASTDLQGAYSGLTYSGVLTITVKAQ